MKPSELLLKALETELAAPPYETFDVSKEIENRRIRLFLQDSGVLDVLDAADENERDPFGVSAQLTEALTKLRERLVEKHANASVVDKEAIEIISALYDERDQLRAEVERYRLAERLPPRPKCPDCGVESLTGNVHDEHCFNWSNIVEERDAARAEVERLTKRLSDEESDCLKLIDERDFREEQINRIADVLGNTTEWTGANDRGENAVELADQLRAEVERLRALLTKGEIAVQNDNDRLKQALAAAKDALARVLKSEALKEAPFYGYCEAVSSSREALAEIEKLEGEEQKK